MPRVLGVAAVLVAVTLGLALPARAQTSEYFLMAGDQSTFHVIQGGVLLRSWSPAPGTAQYQYPLVVTGTIRTMGANVGEIGAEYDLNGNDLGVRYTHPAGPSRSWDGTTDGSFHYAIDSSGFVSRYNQDWTNPVQLFDAGGLGSLTFDPTNNSLWVSQFGTPTITNYTLAGSVISSFTTGHRQNMALALDHADGTLWLHDRTTQGTFEQWSKAGALLNRIAVPGMQGQNALGGEMPASGARCTFRNGNGINQTGYRCATLPTLGGTWTTSYGSSASTIATAMLFGFAPATGPNVLQGELLVASSPPPVAIAGAGNIALPVPNMAALAGVVAYTQGFRVDGLPTGAQIVLLNALDVEFGN